MGVSPVRAVPVSSIPLAVVRRQASAAQLSTLVPKECGTVWTFLTKHGLRGGRHVALYRDDSIRLEIGAEFAGSLPVDSDVFQSATPSGLVATVTHFGPYGQLGAAHAAIREWCAENGRELAGPSWEIYGHWVDAWNADPSLIRTDVFHLLRP